MFKLALVIVFMALFFLPAPAQAMESGTLKDSCAPWDGAAFEIELPDVHLRLTVFTALAAIEKSGTTATFQAEEKSGSKAGDAIILKCDSQGKNCSPRRGSIGITVIGSDVTGVVQLPSAGWGRATGILENHTFRLHHDRDHAALICG